MCRGWGPRYTEYFEGSIELQYHIAGLFYDYTFGRQKRTMGAYIKIWPSLGDKLRGLLQLRKIFPIDIESIYLC